MIAELETGRKNTLPFTIVAWFSSPLEHFRLSRSEAAIYVLSVYVVLFFPLLTFIWAQLAFWKAPTAAKILSNLELRRLPLKPPYFVDPIIIPIGHLVSATLALPIVRIFPEVRAALARGTKTKQGMKGSTQNPPVEAPISPNNEEEKTRRVDAAVQSKARVNETIELFVQVRFRNSPFLTIRDLPVKSLPSSLEQDSKTTKLTFPIDPITHELFPALLCIHIVAPHFTPSGETEKTLSIPPRKYSGLLSFFLIACKEGSCPIRVEILDLNRTQFGTVCLETLVIGDSATHPSGNVASVALTVDVSPMFDVFLSYNSKDREMVREVGRQLSAKGLNVWFDEEELVPGRPWMELLETGIRTSKSIAVFVGSEGFGPWENKEMEAALRLAVLDNRSVIPVFLPAAPAKAHLPLFLQGHKWVDMRGKTIEECLNALRWGITGIKHGQNTDPDTSF